MNSSMDDLHIFFLPFLAPGHMIPMVDMATLFAGRGVKATIVTTVGNASRIQPSIDRSPHPINLLTLSFSSSVEENVTTLNTPDIVNPEFIAGLNALKTPFERLLIDHCPDCIISDILFPWSAEVAVKHGIPRFDFNGSSLISLVTHDAMRKFKPQDRVVSEDEPFVVPGTPRPVELRKSQLMSTAPAHVLDLLARAIEARKNTYGIVMNTFSQMEPGFELIDRKSWLVGPLSLCNQNVLARTVRGGEEVFDCSNWLDSKEPGSVLYVCFGSVGQFSCSQLCEIANGLSSAGHPFIWVVKYAGDTSEWMPEGVEEKGLIITGWAPQTVILNHSSVGGFMTHCGWNSCLEGASAGLPMITWPMYADQFLNEKLLVEVLRIGVAVGSKVSTDSKEKRSWIGRDKVKEVVVEVMGNGEEAEQRRKRAKEIAAAAAKAVEEGGSSYNDLSSLIQELKEVKARKSDPVTVG